MAKISYKTKNNKIILHFSHGAGKVMRVSTGINISIPNNLYKESGDEHETIHGNENRKATNNKKLKKYYVEMFQYFNELEELGEDPTFHVLKKHFKALLSDRKESVQSAPKSFIGLFKYYCDNIANGTIRTKKQSKKYAKDSIKGLRSTYKIFKEYNQQYPILFSRIDKIMFDNLLNYLEDKNYSDQYISKIIARLKAFLTYVSDNGLAKLPNYNPSQFSIEVSEVESQYLTNGELMKLYNLNLEKLDSTYKRVRDVFLIGAFTGLRISDYKKLTDDNISTTDGIRMFEVTAKKTNKKVYIPIPSIVTNIIERNNGVPTISNEQTLNKKIKEVCEWAGIDETVKVSKVVGGKKKVSTHSKFELITSHTARRSYCTNAYLGGLDSLAIMSISGHKGERTFLKYIKVTPKEFALRIAKDKYFDLLDPNKFDKEGNPILQNINSKTA